MKAFTMMDSAQLTDILCKLSCSARAEEPHHLASVHAPDKQTRKLCKRLAASENWQIVDGVIYHASGCSAPAIASWGGIVTVWVAGRNRRYGILYLDYLGHRHIFAIPAKMMLEKFILPGFNFSPAELHLLQLMANELQGADAPRERLITIRYPARETAKEQRDEWRNEIVDGSKLLDLLREEPLLLQVMVALVDAQLRAFKLLTRVPLGIYHFRFQKVNCYADQWLRQLLRAGTFVNKRGRFGMGPIEFTLRDPEDLKVWRRLVNRVVMLRANTFALLQPLLDEGELVETNWKTGCAVADSFPGVPLIISRSILPSEQVAEIQVPPDVTALTGEQLDLLRAAVARILRRKIAEKALGEWDARVSERSAYRLDWFRVWRDVLSRTILHEWFGDSSLWPSAQPLLSETQQLQDLQEREREGKIAKAVELLGHPEQFREQILQKRPTSKAEADEYLDHEAVAFQITFQKGADKGRTALAFTKASLQRLLRRCNCDEAYYEAVLARCEKLALLDSKNRSITLGSETFNAVTIWAEK